MKVILTKDVRDMGRAHSTIEVSDGHALNFLFPRKLAVPANGANVKMAEGKLKKVAASREVEQKLIEERIAALADGKVTITKKANEQGHLYDGVGADEIAEASQLPKEAIHLEKPIKELGTHEVAVASGEGFGKILVDIVAE